MMPNDPLARPAPDPLVTESLRLYERYAEEIVERFDLCPWARRSRREGAVRPWVLLQESPDELAESLLVIGALAVASQVQVALLIYPRLRLGRLDFEHFVRRLRHADSERHELGEVPFAMAAFHPQAAANLQDAERLVPFIRRTPDPTIQLVRADVLEQLRSSSSSGTAFVEPGMLTVAGLAREEVPGIRERIAQNNLETICRVGTSTLEAAFADIARDRSATYARLGEALPSADWPSR
jgi:hypothetical protein